MARSKFYVVGEQLSFVFVELSIPDVVVVEATKHGDGRGFFSETYGERSFFEAGLKTEFVQDNHAFSVQKGTVRGLHFQTAPFAQAKLVRVSRGAIYDVAVDLRVGSPTYGQHAAAVISGDAWNQIFVPIGFAHGFATLEPNTEVLYKVSNFYSAQHEEGLLWNDPVLRIDWPVAPTDAVLSDKDKHQPVLADLPHFFKYEDGGTRK